MSKYSLIVDFLKRFEQTLDDNHEVWLKLPGYNNTFKVLETITGDDEFLAFHLLSGTGEHFSLIQSYSTLNFAVFAKPKSFPDKPAQRIGFKLHGSQQTYTQKEYPSD